MLTPPGAKHRALLHSAAVALSGAAAFVAFPGAAVAAPVTTSYATTGTPQTFTVPGGVRDVRALAIGGRGGSKYYSGGRAARVEATLGVMPGQLQVFVGGNGAGGPGRPGGYNGGGRSSDYDGGASGGGASDIRTAAGDLASRILVAGGGGGAGYGYNTAANGGDAGSPGQGANSYGNPGGAGTQSDGGAGGWSNVGGTGGTGALGQGGTAGIYWYPPYQGAGGGGGGYFGGGGGGSFASGGGGSSFFGPTATGTSAAPDSGPPLVRITYDEVLVADASSLRFGDTATQGTSAPESVTFTNEGDASVTITGADFDFSAGQQGQDYFVSSSTCGGRLAVGSSCVVRVRFAPQAAGSSVSSLIISGADTESGTQTTPVRVALSGTGTALAKGADGADGTNGTNGADGTNGTDGTNGADGTDGKDGTAGTNGADGTDGKDGTVGATGATGATGTTGATGSSGQLDTVMRVVECHRKKGSGARNVVCFFRYTPAKGARLELSFRRRDVALATGKTRGTGGVQKVTLRGKRRLRSGLYLLSLSYRADGVRRTTTRSASIR